MIYYCYYKKIQLVCRQGFNQLLTQSDGYMSVRSILADRLYFNKAFRLQPLRRDRRIYSKKVPTELRVCI